MTEIARPTPDQEPAHPNTRVRSGAGQTVSLERLALMIATILVGLSAGFFFTYEASVTVGLAEVSDVAYVETFQAINDTVQNPAFGIVFFGSIPAIAVAVAANWRTTPSLARVLLVAALPLYLTGLLITGTGKRPAQQRPCRGRGHDPTIRCRGSSSLRGRLEPAEPHSKHRRGCQLRLAGRCRHPAGPRQRFEHHHRADWTTVTSLPSAGDVALAGSLLGVAVLSGFFVDANRPDTIEPSTWWHWLLIATPPLLVAFRRLNPVAVVVIATVAQSAIWVTNLPEVLLPAVVLLYTAASDGGPAGAAGRDRGKPRRSRA